MGHGLTPAGNDGYWGPVTSSLDWCEENYIVSHYVAEWWNTLTNLYYHFYAIIGAIMVYKLGAESRHYWPLGGLALVGTGSVLFHGSLLFETQMMDELPMIFCTCFIVYNLLLTFPNTKLNTTANKKILIVSLSLYSIITCGIYLYLQNPVFHEVAYGALTAIMVLAPIFNILRLRKSYPGKERELWGLYAYSTVTYLGGFFLWNVENFNCDHVRSTRATLGYPFRVWFELHAWWHFLSAIGCHSTSTMSIYMRELALGRTDMELKWFLFVPFLMPATSSTTSTVVKQRQRSLVEVRSDEKTGLLFMEKEKNGMRR
ncbi:Alkaline ceramidase 3 [Blyttiomyces sp. JEL0837]|nr:Alkaline ceramidase 3 [Blyttiomyces sp. JEL0837]